MAVFFCTKANETQRNPTKPNETHNLLLPFRIFVPYFPNVESTVIFFYNNDFFLFSINISIKNVQSSEKESKKNGWEVDQE